MKNFLAILLTFAVSACTEKDQSTNNAVVIDDIMQKQENAWNNGDIDGFMGAYWKNDSLIFIGSRGANYGWQKVLDNYKTAYPDRKTMGTLQFKNIKHTNLGLNAHWVAGKWTLFRETDTLSGHYTLVWKRINDTWLITSDHSS